MSQVAAQLEAWSQPFEVFYDGECPLCVREIDIIRRLDRDDLIIFTDIAAPGFDAILDTGRPFDELMARIHGRLADGTFIEGVEVFRQLYGRTFLRPLVGLTRLPGIRGILRVGYVFFARYRLRLTNRCDAAEGRCTPRVVGAKE